MTTVEVNLFGLFGNAWQHFLRAMPSLLSEYGKKFEDWMVLMFYQYGLVLGKHPFWFLWGPLIFTACCTPGLFFLKINLDLYKLFVPTDAPVRYEFERGQEFNRMPAGNLSIEPGQWKKRHQKRLPRDDRYVFEDVEMERLRRDLELMDDILRFYVVHKNFDNLLQSKYLGPLYDYTNKMMKVTAEYKGEQYYLEDFCKKDPDQTECDNLLNVWIKHADVLFKDGKVKTNPNLQLSYPVLYLFNRPKDIGNVIYGVDVKGEKNEIQGARFPGTPENNAAYFAYREALMDFWHKVMEETEFEFIPHNEKAMDDEMMKIIETTVPFAIPATIMLMFYVVFSNWSSKKYMSKPLEMYLGVWSVILALICTFGIFFFLGIAFNPVTSTMPFLVLAVGIDDDFLMLAAWRELDRRIPHHQKVALVMADAGASITVTSFTNFFCFALGYYMCSTPAVAEFCLITAWAVLIDYVMQITFFAAVICYSGLPYMHKFFGEVFAPFVLRRDVRLISWIVFVIYTCVALYGCCILKVDISPVKYIRDNSPIQTFVKLADKFIWADNVMPTFHVMNPPDLRDAGKRAKLNELVYRLEHTNYSIGRVSTNFWMWQYQQYLNDFPDQSVFLMTWSLLSISMGVCGGLAILGSDLDSVSMGCIVMAIGLAVDYSVHICYRYHRSECTRSSDKVRDTLCSVGWPITQAVTSTLFGLASTAFVPAYLVRVFFQTVYLVNCIGMTFILVYKLFLQIREPVAHSP
ncbi:unnamed protein product [Haemonchus placei]|uniref:SSD domain-containing protein n=1 Tax=Haemonchus placei TaxID=6290 RepID=A0A0N4X4X7_HAEPC|nr:unnamed protein product [Haemonchus placei]